MKRIIIAITIFVASWLAIGVELATAQDAGQRALVRVDASDMAQVRHLPVYTLLRDGAGTDYALVVLPLTEVGQIGLPHLVLDANMRGNDYVIAQRRVAARAPSMPAAQLANAVYDDGQHVIAHADSSQVEALLTAGFSIQWLGDTPLVLRAPTTLVAPQAFVPNSAVASMIIQVQQNAVYSYDAQLSGEVPAQIGGSSYTIATRHTQSGVPLEKATQYVSEHMQALGLTVSYHNWSAYGYSNRNVIGALPGVTRPNEIILITAHLDDMPSGNRAPGADDNASGATAVLVAADILSRYQFERTIRFVFFTGEEQGMLGSGQYATSVYNAGENIVGVLNFDMIAWDSVDGPTLRLHTRRTADSGYSGDLALAGVFTNVVSAYNLQSVLSPLVTADRESASDHASFWSKGYPAILAIEDDWDDFNDYYHTTNDQLQNVNLTYFTNFVKASVGTAAHLAAPLTVVGELTGIVSDAGTGQPISGAEVQASSNPNSTSTVFTGSNGVYSMMLLPGSYSVTASDVRHVSSTVSDVVITTTTRTLNWSLVQAKVIYLPFVRKP